MPSLTALIGTTFLIVLWKGGFLFLRNELSLGALSSVFEFSDDVGVADDCAGVGDKYFSTRRGVHGPVDVHLKCAAEH